MGLTYKDAGVDVEAGNTLVDRIKSAVNETHHESMLSGIGGFAGLASIPSKYQDPILVFGTDGVGTKLELATKYDRHEQIGQDLVAMCVNDVLVPGGEPFVFLDYLATGKLDVSVAERVIRGIARACEIAGCALGGGETAEMPGFYSGSQYDLAGFAIGLVERTELLRHENIAEGDVLVGLGSNGPHSTGYSLIRKLLERGHNLPDDVLQQILAPTAIYAKPVLACLSQIKSMAHITGGGFKDNLPRSFPDHLVAHLDINAWDTPACFRWIQDQGSIDQIEMYSTFNCGIGMVLICSPAEAESVIFQLNEQGLSATRIGSMNDLHADIPQGVLVVGHDGIKLT